MNNRSGDSRACTAGPSASDRGADVLLVGDRLQAELPAVRSALLQHDEACVRGLVRRQLRAGAAALDLNLGVYPGFDSAARLGWLAHSVRELTDVPIWLDTLNEEAIEEVVSTVPGPLVVNSATLDTANLERVLTVVAAHDAGIVILPMQERRLPRDAAAAVSWLAGAALPALTRHNLPLGRVYIDLLALPVTQKPDSAAHCLALARLLRRELGAEIGIVTAPGNVGHGLPAVTASAVARLFARMAVAAGATALIYNPFDRALKNALREPRREPSPHAGDGNRRRLYAELVMAARTGQPPELRRFVADAGLTAELAACALMLTLPNRTD